MKIKDIRLAYRGFAKREGVCGLRIYERQGDYPRNTDEEMASAGFSPQPAARVIIFSELPQNRGTSVTNMMHLLPTTVFYDRTLMDFPEAVDDSRLPIAQTLVIEYYPPDPEAGIPAYELDRFAFVDEGLLPWERAKQQHVYAEPRWRPATKYQVEALIGEPWEPEPL